MGSIEFAADEEDVAAHRFRKLGRPAGHDWTIGDGLAQNRFGYDVSELLRTQHADIHGHVASIEGILRPLDISRKIKEKGSHDLVFGLCTRLWHDKKKRGERCDDDSADGRRVAPAEDPNDLARSRHAANSKGKAGRFYSRIHRHFESEKQPFRRRTPATEGKDPRFD
jgi:hypothetical protein